MIIFSNTSTQSIFNYPIWSYKHTVILSVFLIVFQLFAEIQVSVITPLHR